LVFRSRLKVDKDCVLVLSLSRKGAQIFSRDFRLDVNRLEDISVCIPRNISLAADSICLFFKSSEIEVDVTIFDLALTKTKQSLQPKLFIWDLDNTLWDGVLIEDRDKIQLRNEFIDYIKFLDSIGVQNSICSKNDINEVKVILERFQILEYFNFMEISWNPKSMSVKRIIDNYNFLPNQVFFVDDNVFERIEVELSIDGLNVLSDFELIQSKNCFDYFEDSMGSERRKKYSIEQTRKSIAIIDNNSEGIESYLKKLKIKISINKLSEFSSKSILERCFDLLQRTNQLNLKTVRYNRENFSDLISDSEIDNYSFEVADTFGSYGIVGFLSFRRSNEKLDLVNLVISCRIAEKHIEEDVLYYLILNNYKSYNKLNISLLKTDRNGKLQNLLKNSKCVIENENDKEVSYTLSSEHINYIDLINEVVIIGESI
jgi:FkbH-like protein